MIYLKCHFQPNPIAPPLAHQLAITPRPQSDDTDTDKLRKVSATPVSHTPALALQLNDTSSPATTSGSKPQTALVLSPANADKSRLAFDIMRALGRSPTPSMGKVSGAIPTKRKWERTSDKAGDIRTTASPSAKKQRMDAELETSETAVVPASEGLSTDRVQSANETEVVTAAEDAPSEQVQNIREAESTSALPNMPVQDAITIPDPESPSESTSQAQISDRQATIVEISDASITSTDRPAQLEPLQPNELASASDTLLPQAPPVTRPVAMSYVAENEVIDLTMPFKRSPQPSAFLEEVIPSSEAEEEEVDIIQLHSRASSISLHTPTPVRSGGHSERKPQRSPLFLPSPSPSRTPAPVDPDVSTRETPQSSHEFILDVNLLRPGTPRELNEVHVVKSNGNRSARDGNVEVNDHNARSRASPKKQQAYVLVPPLPEWAIKYSARQKGKARQLRESSSEIIEIEEWDNGA